MSDLQIKRSQKILNSKQEIKDFLGDVSDHVFARYIEIGMPARFENGRWSAFSENIENFFKRHTNISMRKIIKSISDEIM